MKNNVVYIGHSISDVHLRDEQNYITLYLETTKIITLGFIFLPSVVTITPRRPIDIRNINLHELKRIILCKQLHKLFELSIRHEGEHKNDLQTHTQSENSE